MKKNANTREEIEKRLFAKAEACRATFVSARESYWKVRTVSVDAVGTADGAVASQRAVLASAEYRSAMSAYDQALRHFTDFVVFGKMPPEEPGEQTPSSAAAAPRLQRR